MSLLSRLVRRAARTLLLVAAAATAAGAAQAGSLRYCDRTLDPPADQKDVLFRFGAIIKRHLDDAGVSLALLSRSGLNLQRLNLRYSHAGLSLKASPNGPWSVRQLYFACNEGRPRLFDQGLSGFLLGTDDARLGYVSVLLLPPAAADALEQAALDRKRALALLAPRYSANAHAWSVAYQNCNQWVAELLAEAWGGAAVARPEADDAEAGDDPQVPAVSAAAVRGRAQQWLRGAGYQPSTVHLHWRPLVWLADALPWLHNDDHPADDLAAARYRLSMPTAIEAFIRAQVPGAQRIEFCHLDRRVVIHRGWTPVAEGCEPGDGDEVVALAE